jgi:hypothetical protein
MSERPQTDHRTTEFEAHHARLVGLGYRMLGSLTEAEDVVQEAYLRWHRTPRAEIREPGARLTLDPGCRNPGWRLPRPSPRVRAQSSIWPWPMICR